MAQRCSSLSGRSEVFPAALIMYGAAEMDMLARAEHWAGQTSKRKESFDQASGAKMLSSQLVSMLDYRRLLPEDREHARLLQRGTPGIRTEIPDWSVFVARFDAAVAKLLGGEKVSDRSVRQRLLARQLRTGDLVRPVKAA